MNRDNLKQNIKLAEAYLAGKKMQYWNGLVWIDCIEDDYPAFNLNDGGTYRSKPEPQYRAWRAEEVPLGAWIKGKHQLTGTTILASFFSTITVALASNIGEIGFQEALDDWVHSQDQGKTWLPCGVEK